VPTLVNIPAVGDIPADSGMKPLQQCSDNIFKVDKDGVVSITATGDGKVEFIAFKEHTLAYVISAMGYSAYYPVYAVRIERPIEAVLMDLDGTSVKSENFWIWIIEQTTASLLGKPDFQLEEADMPFVSGHSVSEHLQHCISKYCPDKTVEEARKYYFEHTHREMAEITKGRGRSDAFIPTEGLKDFLSILRKNNIKIGLVTSGLYEKAWPEILSAFKSLKMPDPKDFYDAIITAGFPLRKGSVGTLGELSPKPHPWLYAEVCRVGLGIPFEQRFNVIGLEDSGAGVCSIRLAGFAPIGISGGNITESGTRALCSHYCENFEQILDTISLS
jgi:beta-phosphoglucomutase-like phosphatase (HAD superfamily)